MQLAKLNEKISQNKNHKKGQRCKSSRLNEKQISAIVDKTHSSSPRNLKSASKYTNEFRSGGKNWNILEIKKYSLVEPGEKIHKMNPKLKHFKVKSRPSAHKKNSKSQNYSNLRNLKQNLVQKLQLHKKNLSHNFNPANSPYYSPPSPRLDNSNEKISSINPFEVFNSKKDSLSFSLKHPFSVSKSSREVTDSEIVHFFTQNLKIDTSLTKSVVFEQLKIWFKNQKIYEKLFKAIQKMSVECLKLTVDKHASVKKQAKSYWQLVKTTFNECWSLKQENSKLKNSAKKQENCKFFEQILNILGLKNSDLLNQPREVIEVTLVDYLRALFEEGQKLSDLVVEMRDIIGLGEDLEIDEMFGKLAELKQSIEESEQGDFEGEQKEKEGLEDGNGEEGSYNFNVPEVIQEVSEEAEDGTNGRGSGGDDKVSEEDYR